MLLFFSPFSFLFLFVYFLCFQLLFFLSDFYFFWIVIECLAFLFIIVSYSILSFGFSSLILYFIIQSFASLNILFCYLSGLDILVYTFLFLNLSMFPFSFWYVLVFINLDNFLFFFGSTFQNVPPFLLVSYFLASQSSFFIMFCVLFTVLYSSVSIFYSSGFRLLLIFSSVGNNSVLFLLSFYSLTFLLLYFFFYILVLALLFIFFGQFMNFPIFSNLGVLKASLLCFFILFLAGFPPFPIFFLKLILLFFLVSNGVSFSLWFVFLFSFSLVFLLCGYARFIFSFLSSVLGCSLFLLF